MKFKFKQFKKDIMENAHMKLNTWRLKKMAKEKIEGLPKLEERDTADKNEEVEEQQEESKMQLVTNEQLIQFKLDNLGLQVQETNSKIQELIKILKKK